MKSEVEVNQNLVKKGDVLLYSDSCNCETFEVVSIFKGGFTAKGDFETQDYYFNELQSGWQFKGLTKTQKMKNAQFKYV